MFFSWGCGHDGRLGTGNEDNRREPILADIISRSIYKVKKVHPFQQQSSNATTNATTPAEEKSSNTGNNASAVVQKNAFGIEVAATPAAQTTTTTTTTATTEQQQRPNNSATLGLLPLKVNRVFCGGYHTIVEVVLSRSGDKDDEVKNNKNRNNALLLSFGNNEFGQLGLGDMSNRSRAHCVEPFFPVAASEVVFVSAHHHQQIVGTSSSSFSSSAAANATEAARKRRRKNNNNPLDVDETPFLWYNSDDLVDIKCGRFHSVAWFRYENNNNNSSSGNSRVSNKKNNASRKPADDEENFDEAAEWSKISNNNNNNGDDDDYNGKQNKWEKLFVCGRNDSGQLGLNDKENRTCFMELSLDLLVPGAFSNSKISAGSCLLDVSCGAYHSMLLFGPKEAAAECCCTDDASASLSSVVCAFHETGDRRARLRSWIRAKVEAKVAELLRERDEAEEKGKRKGKEKEKDDDAESATSKKLRVFLEETLLAPFSLWACGRGDCGELGVDGDESDTQVDTEVRVKSALMRQQHRSQLGGGGGGGGGALSSSSAVAGGNVWLKPTSSSNNNNNNNNNPQQQTITAAGDDLDPYNDAANNNNSQQQVVPEEEDGTISSILDPTSTAAQWAQKQKQKQQQQSTKVSKPRLAPVVYRVSLTRSQWTRVDLSRERCRLRDDNVVETTSSSTTASSTTVVAITPFHVLASYNRTSVECLVVSLLENNNNNSTSATAFSTSTRSCWLSFGCSYHNRRETLENSIPTEVRLLPLVPASSASSSSSSPSSRGEEKNNDNNCSRNHNDDDETISGIICTEDAEIAWVGSSVEHGGVFVRGGPSSLIIPGEQSELWLPIPLMQQPSAPPSPVAAATTTTTTTTTTTKTTKTTKTAGDGDNNDVRVEAAATAAAVAVAINPLRTVAVLPQGKGALVVCERAVAADHHDSSSQQSSTSIPSQRFCPCGCCCASNNNEEQQQHHTRITLYGLGENFFGQLGVGDENDREGGESAHVTLPLYYFRGEEEQKKGWHLKSLACGSHHAAMIFSSLL